MAGKGLYRVHQFSKVEMFVLATPEQSDALHQELIDIEAEMFAELGLHYKVRVWLGLVVCGRQDRHPRAASRLQRAHSSAAPWLWLRVHAAGVHNQRHGRALVHSGAMRPRGAAPPGRELSRAAYAAVGGVVRRRERILPDTRVLTLV
jgi:hypothetical protein